MRQDIAPHFRRGRGGERRNLGAAQCFEDLIEPEIIGPEIVTPHRKAMGLINGEERDRALSQRFEKRPAPKAFRRNIDQLKFAPGQRSNALALFLRAERTVDQCRGNAAALERIHLVLHQRDQGRDNDRGPLDQKRGQLITKRFAAARRHHNQRIGAARDGADHFLLGVEEFPETEVFFKDFVWGHGASRFWRSSTLSAGRLSPIATFFPSNGDGLQNGSFQTITHVAPQRFTKTAIVVRTRTLSIETALKPSAASTSKNGMKSRA